MRSRAEDAARATIRRSGDVLSLRAETVCANDEFSWSNGEIRHEIEWRKARGEVQAVYAVAVLKSGETQSATLTFDEVENIRKRSRAGNSGPWVTDWAEMAKKTAVRRLSKMLPLSVEVASAIEQDDSQYEMRDVSPAKKAGKSSFALPQLPVADDVEVEEQR